jgi:hypothetical protein
MGIPAFAFHLMSDDAPKRKYSKRELFNGMRRGKTGCQWRATRSASDA